MKCKCDVINDWKWLHRMSVKHIEWNSGNVRNECFENWHKWEDRCCRNDSSSTELYWRTFVRSYTATIQVKKENAACGGLQI